MKVAFPVYRRLFVTLRILFCSRADFEVREL